MYLIYKNEKLINELNSKELKARIRGLKKDKGLKLRDLKLVGFNLSKVA